MKKYQLWLQRKSYSQHLFNLMKIKYAHHGSVEKLDHSIVNRNPSRQNSVLSRYKQLEDYHSQASKLGDVSYAITYKELKNRKLRIMKTFEIMNENMSMARRLKEVKSVFTSTFKDKTNSQHKDRRKLFEKKLELSNDELREQNFKKFMKWQNSKTNHLHRYQFSLMVESISKTMHSSSHYAAVWCEISTQKGFVRSDLVDLSEFQGHKFIFPLDCELPKDCIFRLYVCKGLDSSFVGQIQFRRANIGEELRTTHRSDDCQFQMTIKQKYDKVRRQRPAYNLK